MAYLLDVEIAEPQYRHSQVSIMERMLQEPGLDAKARKLIPVVYRGTAIHERCSVLPDFNPELAPALFFRDAMPDVDDRMRIYYGVAAALATQACINVLAKTGLDPKQVTHLIVCSCTGLQAPGIDVEVAIKLGLDPNIERFGLYFIGCHAALKAIRMARHLCISDPEAVVLIATVELCSIHMTPNSDQDSIMANALFGDGAAACVVTGKKPVSGGFKIEKAFSKIIPHTSKAEMAWTVSSKGFLMRLSSYIPEILAKNFLPSFLKDLHAWQEVPDGDINWLLHPGGRRILDGLAKEMGIPKTALGPSYSVLERYGNMSSPTILYVLKSHLENPKISTAKLSLMLGFGPGLTAEAIVLSS